MLPAAEKLRAEGIECVRLATTDNYDEFLKTPGTSVTQVSTAQALEESFFLGLRLNRGVSLAALREQFGRRVESYTPVIDDLMGQGLLQGNGEDLRLTPRGRLLSNEVFERFIRTEELAAQSSRSHV
jgi:oxygen-independent coproporphyrinogen III oxidase